MAFYAAVAGGVLASRRRIRRLLATEEDRLDREFAAEGYTCFVCGKPMTKWIQVGSGWASGFYIHCQNCGEHGFRQAHDYCVPWYVGSDNLIARLVRFFRSDVKGYNTILVDQCDRCQGSDTLWIHKRAWYAVQGVFEEREMTPEQIDTALEHPHWAVRLACIRHQSLSEEQFSRVLKDPAKMVREAAEEKRNKLQ